MAADKERHPVDAASLAAGCFLGWIAGLVLVVGGLWLFSHLAVIWHG
jgi:hypothetical protein